MDTTARVTLITFIIASMAAVGLHVGIHDLTRALRDRSLMLRTILANLVIIPLVGWALVLLIDLPADARDAILLLACAPGGPSALQFTSKQSGAWASAGAITVVLSLLAVVLSPLIMGWFAPPNVSIIVPYAHLFWWFLLLLVLPLALGVWFKWLRPAPAAVLCKIATLLGTLAFIAFVVLTLSLRRAATHALDATPLLTMIGFILLCMIVGFLLGGPPRGQRRVLAASSSMRNVAVCLAIVSRSFPGLNIEVPLVAFSALMIPPNMLFFLTTRARDWHARRMKAHP